MRNARWTTGALAFAALMSLQPDVSADEPEYAGTSCSLAVSNSPTGSVNAFSGAVASGLWASADYRDSNGLPGVPAVSNVRVTCVVQVADNSAHGPGSSGVSRATGAAVGAAAAAGAVSFSAAVGQGVYVCTYVEMTASSGSRLYTLDADGRSENGAQCVSATETSRGDSRAYVLDGKTVQG